MSNHSNNTEVHLTIPQHSQSNQNEFRYNNMDELLKSQEIINQKLTESIESIEKLFQTRHEDQKERNQTLTKRMEKQDNAQDEILASLTKLESTVTKKLEILNNEQHELIQAVDKDESFHQALLAQLSTHDQTSNQLMFKLHELEKKLITEFNEQIQKCQRELSSKIEIHDVYHQTVMERIDQQEAITHKMDRQLDSLKSLVYERIAHLTEKIESQSKQMIKSFSGFFFKPTKQELDNVSSKQQTNIK